MVEHSVLLKQWRKAGKTYYYLHRDNPEWQKRTKERAKKSREKKRFGRPRDEILKEANYVCKICGSKKRVVIHHIDGNGRQVPEKERNNAKENLIVLCQTCHMTIQNFAKLKNNPLAVKLTNKFPS